MTSSLLSLQPFMTFILKWKSFLFSLHDESLPTCPNVFFNYRSLHCLVINPSNQFFPFQSVSSHGQMKHLEGTQARGQNFLRYLDFLPGDVSLWKPYRYVPPQRVWFFRLFRSIKNGYTLCSFWFEIGYGFRANYRSVRTHYSYLSFQFQMNKKEKEKCEFFGRISAERYEL